MVKRYKRSRLDPTTFILLAAVGVVGALVARRYGLLQGLRTVNRALGVASVVRAPRKPRARPVRPKVVRFSRPG